MQQPAQHPAKPVRQYLKPNWQQIVEIKSKPIRVLWRGPLPPKPQSVPANLELIHDPTESQNPYLYEFFVSAAPPSDPNILHWFPLDEPKVLSKISLIERVQTRNILVCYATKIVEPHTSVPMSTDSTPKKSKLSIETLRERQTDWKVSKRQKITSSYGEEPVHKTTIPSRPEIIRPLPNVTYYATPDPTPSSTSFTESTCSLSLSASASETESFMRPPRVLDFRLSPEEPESLELKVTIENILQSSGPLTADDLFMKTLLSDLKLAQVESDPATHIKRRRHLYLEQETVFTDFVQRFFFLLSSSLSVCLDRFCMGSL